MRRAGNRNDEVTIEPVSLHERVPAAVVLELLQLNAGSEVSQAWRAKCVRSPEPVSLEDFAVILADCVWCARRKALSDDSLPLLGSYRFVLRTMAGGRTLRDAIMGWIDIINTMWPAFTVLSFDEGGDRAIVTVERPSEHTNDNFLHLMYGVSLDLSALSWMTGGKLVDMRANFAFRPQISAAALRYLFPYPISFEGEPTTLSIAARDLTLPIIRSADEVEEFSSNLSMIAATGIASPESLSRSVAALIRHELVTRGRQLSLERASELLQRSYSTARRQLELEGTSYRQIRDEVLQDLAISWLSPPEASVRLVSEKLGFSEAGSFRRWFQRQIGMSVGAYRRGAAERIR